jgi:hypothetical protein
VIVQRVSIAEGAFCKGVIDITHRAQEMMVWSRRGSPVPNSTGLLLPFRRRSKQAFDMHSPERRFE